MSSFNQLDNGSKWLKSSTLNGKSIRQCWPYRLLVPNAWFKSAENSGLLNSSQHQPAWGSIRDTTLEHTLAVPSSSNVHEICTVRRTCTVFVTATVLILLHVIQKWREHLSRGSVMVPCILLSPVQPGVWRWSSSARYLVCSSAAFLLLSRH